MMLINNPMSLANLGKIEYALFDKSGVLTNKNICVKGIYMG